VGHGHQTTLCAIVAQEGHHLQASALIQQTRRLVGKDDPWPVDHGPARGHPLPIRHPSVGTPIQVDVALGTPPQPAKQVEQRALAGTRRSQDADERSSAAPPSQGIVSRLPQDTEGPPDQLAKHRFFPRVG
jgi:hypothetical protein